MMALFSDLTDDDEDIDPETGQPRIFKGIPTQAGAAAVHDVTPPSVGGFLKNIGSDIAEVGSAFGSLALYPVLHPVKTAEGAARAIVHPIETAKTVGKAAIAPYVPEEGESFLQHLGTRAYEHPFSTALDAAFLVQGPFSLAAKGAELAGTARTAAMLTHVAEVGEIMDPIRIAQKTGVKLWKSVSPDTYAAVQVQKEMARWGAGEIAKRRFHAAEAERMMGSGEGGVMEHLNPAERSVFFPYAEGRFYIDELGAGTEAASSGLLIPHADKMPLRKEALDAAVQRYIPIQQKLDVLGGTDQLSVVGAKRDRFIRDAHKDPNFVDTPEWRQELDKQEAGWNQEWQTQRDIRRTVSLRTHLDVAKQKAYEAEVLQIKEANHLDTVAEAEAMLPRPTAATPEEALKIMGPGGGVIIPHSGEVFSGKQSTISNILTKAREASMFKENTGALFRSGALDQLNAADAVIRHYVALQGGSVPKQIADSMEKLAVMGPKYAERVGPEFSAGLDRDMRAGTHQLIDPHQGWQEALQQDDLKKVATRLLEVGDDDPAAKQQILQELGERMSAGADTAWPLRADRPRYKVPTYVGTSLKQWRNSFEPATNPFAIIGEKVGEPWNFMNLNLRPTRMVNNFVGNIMFVGMHGVHPFSRDGLSALIDAGRAALYKSTGVGGEHAAELAKVLELPGVGGSGFIGGAEGAGASARGYAQKLIEGKGRLSNPLSRFVGQAGHFMQETNARMEDAFRAATTIFDLRKGAAKRGLALAESGQAALTATQEITRLRGLGAAAIDDTTLKSALDFTNKALNNYDRATGFERSIVRRIFPYYQFYQHSATMLIHHGFEAPAKNALMRRLGSAALQDTKDTLKGWGFDWNTMVPESMQDSLPIAQTEDKDGNPQVIMASTTGPNPFNILSKDISDELLQSIHPIAKAAIESITGINTFRGERFRGAVSSAAGREADENGRIVATHARPGIGEALLKQFWPYQTLKEMVAGGQIPTDTASLLDLLTNSPTAYDLDAQGVPRRRDRAFGAFTPLLNVVGARRQVLQAPTAGGAAQLQGAVNSQLNDLYQRNPEMFQALVDAIQEESAKYRQEEFVRPRR